METKQLEYFCAVVEQGTVSGAAKVLNMTQPPVSYQMKMLEEELQVQLFFRGMKRITLTEAGKVLYARAVSILKMLDITKREVLKASQSATIHIGITPSTVPMMSEYIESFSKKHPEIHFDIHEGSTFNLKEQLENHVVDITTLRTPITLNGCATKQLIKEKLVAMVSEEYYCRKNCPYISLKELSGEHLILSHRYRNYMISAFEAAGLTCDIYYECEDARTAMTIAEKGIGVAILPKSMSDLDNKLRVYEISDADLTTEILLVWRDEYLATEVNNFIEEIGYDVD